MFVANHNDRNIIIFQLIDHNSHSNKTRTSWPQFAEQQWEFREDIKLMKFFSILLKFLYQYGFCTWVCRTIVYNIIVLIVLNNY